MSLFFLLGFRGFQNASKTYAYVRIGTQCAKTETVKKKSVPKRLYIHKHIFVYLTQMVACGIFSGVRVACSISIIIRTNAHTRTEFVFMDVNEINTALSIYIVLGLDLNEIGHYTKYTSHFCTSSNC